jgi:hypothetical protein
MNYGSDFTYSSNEEGFLTFHSSNHDEEAIPLPHSSLRGGRRT